MKREFRNAIGPYTKISDQHAVFCENCNLEGTLHIHDSLGSQCWFAEAPANMVKWLCSKCA